MGMKELITNNDGRLSTTAFIQFFGALLMAGVLVYTVWLDRSYVGELFTSFAIFCGGGAATKGFAPDAAGVGQRSQDTFIPTPAPAPYRLNAAQARPTALPDRACASSTTDDIRPPGRRPNIGATPATPVAIFRIGMSFGKSLRSHRGNATLIFGDNNPTTDTS